MKDILPSQQNSKNNPCLSALDWELKSGGLLQQYVLFLGIDSELLCMGKLRGRIILFLHGFENGDEIIDAFRICEA